MTTYSCLCCGRTSSAKDTRVEPQEVWLESIIYNILQLPGFPPFKTGENGQITAIDDLLSRGFEGLSHDYMSMVESYNNAKYECDIYTKQFAAWNDTDPPPLGEHQVAFVTEGVQKCRANLEAATTKLIPLFTDLTTLHGINIKDKNLPPWMSEYLKLPNTNARRCNSNCDVANLILKLGRKMAQASYQRPGLQTKLSAVELAHIATIQQNMNSKLTIQLPPVEVCPEEADSDIWCPVCHKYCTEYCTISQAEVYLLPGFSSPGMHIKSINLNNDDEFVLMPVVVDIDTKVCKNCVEQSITNVETFINAPGNKDTFLRHVVQTSPTVCCRLPTAMTTECCGENN